MPTAFETFQMALLSKYNNVRGRRILSRRLYIFLQRMLNLCLNYDDIQSKRHKIRPFVWNTNSHFGMNGPVCFYIIVSNFALEESGCQRKCQYTPLNVSLETFNSPFNPSSPPSPRGLYHVEHECIAKAEFDLGASSFINWPQ